MNSTRVTEYLSWIEKMQNSINCSDTWFDVSLKRLAEYRECEGDLTINWKESGYKMILDLLMVRNDLNIGLNEK